MDTLLFHLWDYIKMTLKIPSSYAFTPSSIGEDASREFPGITNTHVIGCG